MQGTKNTVTKEQSITMCAINLKVAGEIVLFLKLKHHQTLKNMSFFYVRHRIMSILLKIVKDFLQLQKNILKFYKVNLKYHDKSEFRISEE